MISAAVLVAALLAGKIALASLSIAQIATLASAGFTVAQLAVKVEQKIAPSIQTHQAHQAQQAQATNGKITAVVQGGPGGWGRAPVIFR